MTKINDVVDKYPKVYAIDPLSGIYPPGASAYTVLGPNRIPLVTDWPLSGQTWKSAGRRAQTWPWESGIFRTEAALKDCQAYKEMCLDDTYQRL